MFAFQYPRSQVFGRIPRQDRHPHLGDHRAAIKIGTHVVHAGTVFAGACSERLLVGVKPLEQGQQGGVDIDDAAKPGHDFSGVNQAHITGAHDQIRRTRINPRKQRVVEVGAGGKVLWGECVRGNSSVARAFQCLGLWAVRENAASRAADSTASIMACRLLPRPEARIASRNAISQF